MIRVILYIQLVKYIDELTTTPSSDNHFGMFLANVFTTNKGVAILATFTLIVLIILCYSISLTSIKYLSELEHIVHMRAKLCDDRAAYNLLSKSHDWKTFKGFSPQTNPRSPFSGNESNSSEYKTRFSIEMQHKLPVSKSLPALNGISNHLSDFESLELERREHLLQK